MPGERAFKAMGELRAPIGPNTAHLCIDMQRLFSDEGPWPLAWMPRVTPKVEQLVARAPERTIFTRFIPPEKPEDAPRRWRVYYEKWSHVTRRQIDNRLIDLLPVLTRYAPPAVIFDKAVYSAFGNSQLHQHLRERQIDTLIVSGSETDVCVLSSILAAVDYGYRIIIAEDAVCSSSDEGHDALIGLFNQRFDVQLEPAKVEAILSAWQIL
jgi:nicotinamidase-related amidase